MSEGITFMWLYGLSFFRKFLHTNPLNRITFLPEEQSSNIWQHMFHTSDNALPDFPRSTAYRRIFSLAKNRPVDSNSAKDNSDIQFNILQNYLKKLNPHMFRSVSFFDHLIANSS